MDGSTDRMIGAETACGDPAAFPEPGSPGELRRFAELQRRLAPLFRRAFPDPRVPQTVVVVPSMTLDAAELEKLSGAPHYEERLLCILMLLRRPRTHVVYVTSQPITPSIVDYYLNLLPGVPARHARERLTLLSCHDGSPLPLTQKILARPRLCARIRDAIADPAAAHLTCFNATPLERTLAVRLGIPLYGCDPALAHLGSKSGSREVFRRAGVPLPDGYEHLRDGRDVAAALAALRRRDPSLSRAVVKLNEGFSGEGNAVFSFADAPLHGLEAWVRGRLPTRLRFEAPRTRAAAAPGSRTPRARSPRSAAGERPTAAAAASGSSPSWAIETRLTCWPASSGSCRTCHPERGAAASRRKRAVAGAPTEGSLSEALRCLPCVFSRGNRRRRRTCAPIQQILRSARRIFALGKDRGAPSSE